MHPSQFPLYANPAAISQLERERLGIPPHLIDPADPMVKHLLVRNKPKIVYILFTNFYNDTIASHFVCHSFHLSFVLFF